jgi:hypothetical protein
MFLPQEIEKEHNMACRWITIAIILHNLILDVEGAKFTAHFAEDHQREQETQDCGNADEPFNEQGDRTEGMRRRLVTELMAFRQM